MVQKKGLLKHSTIIQQMTMLLEKVENN